MRGNEITIDTSILKRENYKLFSVRYLPDTIQA